MRALVVTYSMHLVALWQCCWMSARHGQARVALCTFTGQTLRARHHGDLDLRDEAGGGDRERSRLLSLCFFSFFECFFSFFLSFVFLSRLCLRSSLEDELDDESESEDGERERLRCFLSFFSFLCRFFSFRAFRSSSSWNSLTNVSACVKERVDAHLRSASRCCCVRDAKNAASGVAATVGSSKTSVRSI